MDAIFTGEVKDLCRSKTGFSHSGTTVSCAAKTRPAGPNNNPAPADALKELRRFMSASSHLLLAPGGGTFLAASSIIRTQSFPRPLDGGVNSGDSVSGNCPICAEAPRASMWEQTHRIHRGAEKPSPWESSATPASAAALRSSASRVARGRPSRCASSK